MSLVTSQLSNKKDPAGRRVAVCDAFFSFLAAKQSYNVLTG